MLLASIAVPSYAQDTSITDPDAAFKAARELAFSGKRQEGRNLALRIIARYPAYKEIKTFIGRTYAWEGTYDSARYYFQDVAATDPKPLDNFIAWIDAERWANQPAQALALTEQALGYFKDDVELLYRKAKLYSLTGRLADAKMLTHKILLREEKHGPTYILLQELRSQLLYNGVAAGLTFEGFSKYYNPMYTSFIQGSKITRTGSIIARLNYANRFTRTAFQPELDFYPRIYKGVYAYLNYGFSNGELFPKHRMGAEIFMSLPNSFEASIGLRYLYFSKGSKVTVYTGALGYYVGNYWLSFRPNITLDSGRTSASASLTARKYFAKADRFLSLRIGAGFSPELQNFQSSSGAGSKGFYSVKSQNIGLSYQHPFNKQWMLVGGLDLLHQEVAFNPGEYIYNYGLSAALKYRFK
jgi:YaiO family outer membrane protein